MSWFGVGALALGVGSTLSQGAHAKKMARKQAALGRASAAKLRDRYAEVSAGSKREIETLRTLRSMDIPAFRQASEQAVIQAQKGSERMQRQRMMGNQPGEVRDAIFGGQFQQYVGREMQRLGKHAQLTQTILQATNQQQSMAMQVESQAIGMEMGGESASINTLAEAGSTTAGILAAVGSAAGTYASAQSAKADAKTTGDTNFKRQAALQTLDAKSFRDASGKLDMGQFNTWFDGLTTPGN